MINKESQHILSVVESKRKQLGMSKAELARRMEIEPVTLGTILRGKRCLLAEEALLLCACLDIEPAELLSPSAHKLHSNYWGKKRSG